ncbi:MAG: Heavy-metal resistance [Acidobacteriota bacterium]|jgi:Spy/CpxP family protein refolding chaperone|nr:Heavy-metal resistance [Acidobacteriota bacterium]
MKRIALILTLVLATATAAFTQQGPPPGGGPPRPAGPDPLIAYLNLTAEQKAAWEAARAAFETSTQPLFEKQREAQEQLGTLLEGKSTDSCAIGTQMIAIRTIGDQIKAAHDALDAKFEASLTAEQKSKYEAFEAAVQFLRDHEGPPRPPQPPR